jgi:hypothetical protein
MNSLVDSVIAGLCALRSNGEPPPSDEPGLSEPSKYLYRWDRPTRLRKGGFR